MTMEIEKETQKNEIKTKRADIWARIKRKPELCVSTLTLHLSLRYLK